MLFLTCTILTAPILGCKPANNTLPILGSVTLDGQPLDSALILFVPLNSGRKKTGGEVSGGQYHITAKDGLAPGRYRVEFLQNYFPAEATPGFTPGKAYSPDEQAQPEVLQVIPSWYSKESLLSLEVTPDTKKIDFALSSKAAPSRDKSQIVKHSN